MKDAWHSKQSHFNLSTTKNGKLKVTAIYNIGGILFRATLTEQQSERYPMRGRLVVLSSHDGHVLQMTGAHRDEVLTCLNITDDVSDHRIEALNIKTELHCTSKDVVDLKAVIDKAARRLYIEYSDEIYSDLGKIDTSDLTFLQSVKLYSVRYLDPKHHLSEAARAAKTEQLLKVASYLLDYTMSSISQTALRTLYDELGKAAPQVFRLAKDFCDFCLARSNSEAKNPFAVYLECNPVDTKESPETLARRAAMPRDLPLKTAQKLRKIITDANPLDAKATCLLLIKEAGVSTEDAASLTWGDIIFNGADAGLLSNIVQIKLKHDHNIGSTHDYTRPMNRFAVAELSRRRDAAIIKYGASYQRQHLLQAKNESILTTNAQSNCCRTFLQQAKFNTDGSDLGIGALHRNYKYILDEYCGLTADNGASLFLQGKSLNHDVTADHYRSFTDPEGQYQLFKVLDRDKRFAVPYEGSKIQCTTASNGTHEIVVHSRDLEHFTEFECTFYLAPGQFIELESEDGIEGYFSAAPVKDKKWNRNTEMATGNSGQLTLFDRAPDQQ